MERSVTAETLFNHLSKKNTASSAGIDVIGEKGEGKGPSEVTYALFLKRGHDVSGHKRKHITKQMFGEADKIVLLLSKSEEKYLPEYIKNSNKTIHWEIEGGDHSKAAHEERLEKIEKWVKELVKEIG